MDTFEESNKSLIIYLKKINIHLKIKVIHHTTLDKIKSLNFSLLQLPSKISTAIYPSSDNAGKIVYLFPRKKITLC